METWPVLTPSPGSEVGLPWFSGRGLDLSLALPLDKGREQKGGGRSDSLSWIKETDGER